MKLLKKLLLLCASITCCLGFAVGGIACGDTQGNTPSSSESASTSSVDASSEETSSEESEPASYVYRVRVQNETGYGFRNVTVTLMDGETQIAQKTTNSAGNANFDESDVETVGTYTIKLGNLPKGYLHTTDKDYVTVALKNTETIVYLKPQGTLLEGKPAAGSLYRLGDVMHDFTVTATTYDKDAEKYVSKPYTLSEVLKEKKLVLINFWATWCGPCVGEFPYMHNATMLYEDTVSVIALSTTDDKSNVDRFQSDNSYTHFNMAPVGNTQLEGLFGVGGIPHSVMVDRYGVVVFNEVGSMPSVSAFTSVFDRYVGDDYVSTVYGSDEAPDDGGDGETEDPLIKPNVNPDPIDQLVDTLTQDETVKKNFNFRYQEEEGLEPGDEKYDEYNWPWKISEDKEYIYASNRNYHNSYAILYVDFTVKAGDVLTFDYKINTEKTNDIFYILLNDTKVKEISGYNGEDWKTCHAYVFEDWQASKTHSMGIVYLKDETDTAGDDVVFIKNLRLETVKDLDSPEVDANIFRNAATDLNTDENAKTQFRNYVDVVYNEEDQYYHVGKKDGPVLYANMFYASPWSESSVWLLAFYDYVVGNGINYHSAIEEFAWEANQVHSMYGYTAVTEDLKYLLDAMCRYVEVYKKWDGEYHDKEWLEVCVYYEHYGQTEPMEDPLKTITFTAAAPLQVGDNMVNVPYAMAPRGFKYKFIPETSGVYYVQSTGAVDTEVFMFASDRQTMLGNWTDKPYAESTKDENGVTVADGNFEFYWYFEAGETYYMLFTTFLDVSAAYNVNISYVGKTHTYLETCATGPYSINMTTNEMFIPNAVEYAYSEDDGYYHVLNADGSLGSVIYFDTQRPTAFFPRSVYDVCLEALEQYVVQEPVLDKDGNPVLDENGKAVMKDVLDEYGNPVKKYYYPPEKRAFYVNGTDYTTKLRQLGFFSLSNEGRYRGFVAVDQEVFEILREITMSVKYEGIHNSWLMLCYYDKTLGA